MRGKTQADRLAKLMQKHQIYNQYMLALPLVEVKLDMLQKLQENDVILLDFKSLSLVLLEGQKVCAGLLPLGRQGHSFEVISVSGRRKSIEASPKYQVLVLALDKIQHQRLKVGDIIKVANMSFDKIELLINDKKIAQGALVNVDGKIALQIDKVEEER